MKKLLLFCLLFGIHSVVVFATHNRAGEITYRQISGLTYEITLTTYTYTPSRANETRDTLSIDWGDGTGKEAIHRIVQQELPNNITHNVYKKTHTYPGVGTYSIVMIDPNRNEGINNISNSVNVVFAIKTVLKISTIIGSNSTPVLLNLPIDKGFVGKTFVHNPGAYDAEGDSLSYKIATCLGDDGLPIPGYTLPPTSNKLEINAITGDLTWDSPTTVGKYNIAILIEEWRAGVKIGQVLRDMQIDIYETDEKSPVFKSLSDVCVLAGDTVKFDVEASNPDVWVTLSATGGCFEVKTSPAVFDSVKALSTAKETFFWKTDCSHIRKYPYLVTFKAETPSKLNQTVSNNGSNGINLVTFQNVNITVVAPPPLNLKTSSTNRTIKITWEQGKCTGATSYKIYRKQGQGTYTPPECVTGLPAESGYELIGTSTELTYLDNNNGQGLVQGFYYCYRIVGVYSDGAESYPSAEVCAMLSHGLTLITNVDVKTTDKNNGEIEIKWAKPTKFNADNFPGPYRYIIFRSLDLWGALPVKIASIDGIENYSYTDKNINTTDTPASYIVSLYNIDGADLTEIGASDVAASVFVKPTALGKKIKLTIQTNTPWVNDTLIIYRKNPQSTTFDSINYIRLPEATNTATYLDENLINGETYCYFVRSIGKYSDPIMYSLINNSEQVCAVPQDTIVPCTLPITAITVNCSDSTHVVSWTYKSEDCSSDVVKYNLYYKSTLDEKWQLLKSYEPSESTGYTKKFPIFPRGCYSLTAVDGSGNESKIEDNMKCATDICEIYKLPNVFTPNGDNQNDLYRPVFNKGIEKVNMRIYNRWGELIFETDNPEINWNGKYKNTGKMVTDGVYYYLCDVYEPRVTGTFINVKTGFIHVYPNKKVNND